MKGLVAQTQRIPGDGAVEFVAGGTAPVAHQRFVATEGAEPVTGGSTAGSDAEVSEQIVHPAAARDVNAGGHRCGLHEMKVAIDKPGRHGTARQADHAGFLTDQCFEVGELAVGDDKITADSDGIAVGMAEDIAAVQNEVSFFESYHQLPTHPP
jgi:hypothetical protein